MRHGRAAPQGTGTWTRDRERPLSEEGRIEMRRAGEGLAAAGVWLDVILCSPLVRACETARLVARAQPAIVAVDEREELAPGFSPDTLFAALGELPERARVLLVGHEPDMGLLAARLLGVPDSHVLPFTPGAITRIDVACLPTPVPGQLVWMLTAALACALAD